MTCPKCSGLVEGPEWERTDQGYVYTVHCLNCGFRVNDDFVQSLDFAEKVKEDIQQEHINREFAVRYGTTRKLVDLSKYDFGDKNDI